MPRGKPKGLPPPKTAWKPGQSGNPGGRYVELTKEIKALCREMTPDAMDALREMLKTPGERGHAVNTLLAYGYGRPETRIQIRVVRSFADLSGEELDALIAEAKTIEGAAEEDDEGA